MKKSDLVAAAAEKAGVSKSEAEAVLNAITATIVEAVAAEDKVQLVGFGTFECRQRSAKVGKNPRTGEQIDIPASKNPAFKPGKAFKDAVNA